jgi:hypothetical protein
VSWTLLGLLGAMTALRLLAKVASAEAVARPIPGSVREEWAEGGRGLRASFFAHAAWSPAMTPTPGWGQGLVPQGNLGLMVALTAYHVWADDVGLAVLAAVAIASLVNELLAPLMLARAVAARREG